MFTCVLGRYVASTVLLVPNLSECADSVGGQSAEIKVERGAQWRNRFWQSLEEGAGKRCRSVSWCMPRNLTMSMAPTPRKTVMSQTKLLVFRVQRLGARSLRSLGLHKAGDHGKCSL